jgi:hypothetical protein
MLEMMPAVTLPRKAILSRTTTSAQKDDLAEDGSITESGNVDAVGHFALGGRLGREGQLCQVGRPDR